MVVKIYHCSIKPHVKFQVAKRTRCRIDDTALKGEMKFEAKTYDSTDVKFIDILIVKKGKSAVAIVQIIAQPEWITACVENVFVFLGFLFSIVELNFVYYRACSYQIFIYSYIMTQIATTMKVFVK